MYSLLMKNSEIDLATTYEYEDCVKELGNFISHVLFIMKNSEIRTLTV